VKLDQPDLLDQLVQEVNLEKEDNLVVLVLMALQVLLVSLAHLDHVDLLVVPEKLVRLDLLDQLAPQDLLEDVVNEVNEDQLDLQDSQADLVHKDHLVKEENQEKEV